MAGAQGFEPHLPDPELPSAHISRYLRASLTSDIPGIFGLGRRGARSISSPVAT